MFRSNSANSSNLHGSAAATNLSCIITFLLWKPDPKQLHVFFLLAALWGMADAVWQTQTNGEKSTTDPVTASIGPK